MVPDDTQYANLSDSVYLSALSYAATSSVVYSTHINTAIRTWFVDDTTRMNPTLEYAQVIRGPGNQTGKHTGVLDGKGLTKIVAGVMLLREINPAEWEDDVDAGFVSWVTDQVTWLETNEVALAERAALNNHGTFYYNQLVSLYHFLNETDKAVAALNEFYSTNFPGQISADGDQPLETIRTRPFHYRSYNLNALVVNAQLGDAVGLSPPGWNRTTSHGTTLMDALSR
ncbi:hypothetical protein P7C73_g5164, partial [Tremellales sp. Uapishka_1]